MFGRLPSKNTHEAKSVQERKGIMYYLTTEQEGRKGVFLFNDALNTLYLRLYGVRHNGKGPLK